ncbi:NADH-quinone oxidoreductase subunit C [SAR202 cluster bacterium AD-804-J14_MRT_500m]|nr:NADH-quinone oxidoreductase subunit C [SAR202 cluster bacterium AD-804-J14_MRT_500m]
MVVVATRKPKTDDGLLTSGLSQERREFLDIVLNVLGDLDAKSDLMADRPQITVQAASVADVCRTLKQDSRTLLKTLLCIAAVDFKDSIQVIYMLLSMGHEQVLAIKTDLDSDDPKVPSVTSVWAAANWHEREAHDLFGVTFEGHPDLSPLLLYDGFEGFPGRKDFPFHEYDEF